MKTNWYRLLANGLLAGALLFALGGLAIAPAAARPAAMTLPDSDDSFVDPNSGNTTKNYDAGQPGGGRLEVTYSNFPGFSPTRRSYLKFPLGALPGPASRSLLKLTIVSNNIPAGGTVNLALYSVTNDGWSEGALTFANAPGSTTLLQTVAVNSGYLGVVQFGDTAADNAVGTYIESQRAGDGQASFLLVFSSGAGNLGFAGNILFEDLEGTANGINGDEPFIEPYGPTAITLSGGAVRAERASSTGAALALGLAVLGGVALVLARSRHAY